MKRKRQGIRKIKRMQRIGSISVSFRNGMSRTFMIFTDFDTWTRKAGGLKDDYKALRRDWGNVGNTIRKETRSYGAGYRG